MNLSTSHERYTAAHARLHPRVWCVHSVCPLLRTRLGIFPICGPESITTSGKDAHVYRIYARSVALVNISNRMRIICGAVPSQCSRSSEPATRARSLAKHSVDRLRNLAQIDSDSMVSTQMIGVEAMPAALAAAVDFILIADALRRIPCAVYCHLDVSPVCCSRFLLIYSFVRLWFMQCMHKHLYSIALNAMRNSLENRAYMSGLMAELQ